jgi:hypothetical protein
MMSDPSANRQHTGPIGILVPFTSTFTHRRSAAPDPPLIRGIQRQRSRIRSCNEPSRGAIDILVPFTSEVTSARTSQVVFASSLTGGCTDLEKLSTTGS